MEGRSRDASNKDTCWFVPLAELDNPEGARLQRAFSPLAPTDKLVEYGGAFTITVETFLINKNHDDAKSGNDLLVKSQVRYGSEPPTEAINFFGMDVPAGKVKDNLEFEHVFGKENHLLKNRVWIEVSIIEVDKGLNDETAVLGELSRMNKQFGAVFPTLIPFAGPVSSAVLGLAKLAALQQQNQVVFNSQVDFYGLFPEGEAKLRCGAYVLFNQLTEGVKYRLRGLHLEYFAVADRELPIQDDYVVIKVVPALVSSGDSQELRKNQQVAAILNHAQGTDPQAVRDEQREVLKDIVGDALKFQDLGNFIDLKEMKELGSPLSNQQMETFVELSKRLRDILNALK
jgi:hypothetical protein